MSEACEFPQKNADSGEVKEILLSSKTVAVVGISDKPERPSYHVAEYLLENDYRVIPVNPLLKMWKGIQAFADLDQVPGDIDIVDIFRKPEEVPAIVDAALRKKARVIWMQEGIVNNAAADLARAAGLRVVMNKCMLKEHRALH